MLEQLKSNQNPSVRRRSFYDKIMIFLTLLALASCTPPAEENEEGNEASNDVKCKVNSNSSVTTGQELVAKLTCTASTIYQGKKLNITYDESLASLKLVVGAKETVGQSGKLSYILPRKKEFQAKLKLTGVTAGTGQLQFKILRKKSNWDFTVVRGSLMPSTPKALTLGVAVTATAFTKMQDTSGKAYGRSVMRLDTSQTLVSNDKTSCQDAPLNALLVSSDDFLNCEKVHVQKGDNTNHVIIPKQTWDLNKTYKVAVKTASGASAFNRSGNPVSFTTNNANHNTAAHVTGFDVGSRPKVLNNQFHLEKDGELWYYISKGNTAPSYSSSECRSINYKATDNKQFRNLTNTNQTDRAFARTIFSSDSYYIINSNAGVSFYYLKASADGNTTPLSVPVGQRSARPFYYLCFVKIPERA